MNLLKNKHNAAISFFNNFISYDHKSQLLKLTNFLKTSAYAHQLLIFYQFF